MRLAFSSWPQTSGKTTALFAVWICVSAVVVGAAEPTKDSLEDVKKNLEGKKAVLVDVRESDEWQSGHLAVAQFLPLSQLREGISDEELEKRLPKKKVIYTHCASGFRSCTAADVLGELGYEVRPLKPGYEDLLKAGFRKAE